MPYFFSETCLAGTSSLKADFGSSVPAYPAWSRSESAVALFDRNIVTSDTSLFSFAGSSYYSLTNFVNRNIHRNFIPGKALAEPPAIT